MTKIPLTCPLCMEQVEEADIQRHNDDHHDGKGLVQPSPLPEEDQQ